MPKIQPIHSITFSETRSHNVDVTGASDGSVDCPDSLNTSVQTSIDISSLIAPPYDVLDEGKKAALLADNSHNIATIDLPHLPAKTVGPDETYEATGDQYRQWLNDHVLVQREKPALFVYQQTYTHDGNEFKRRGLLTNITLQEFGPPPEGSGYEGGVHPHEQTFSGPKEDRLKLMRATEAQLSPIFGLYSDPDDKTGALLGAVIDARLCDYFGTTKLDGVLHEVWVVEDEATIEGFSKQLSGADVFIADGHHRYNTALNYRSELKDVPDPANYCMFVLIAMQDPGMIVLPTHRVLGGLNYFSIDRFIEAAADKLNVTPFDGDLAALEQALPSAGPHAIGLYDSGGETLWIANTNDDPLAESHASYSDAWRQLDVAIAQHLIVESICEPTFCEDGAKATWKFPHTLDEVRRDANTDGYQLGLIMQPTPLDAIRLVSEAGELMPQKSTFFYPKVATGLVINPLR